MRIRLLTLLILRFIIYNSIERGIPSENTFSDGCLYPQERNQFNMNPVKPQGFITNIQPFSLDDGPGIRTTVFFRGCNLRCAWCHNPECIPFQAVLRYNESVCIGCGLCGENCPNGCHQLDETGHVINRAACSGCGACVSACPAGALELNGRGYSEEELFKILDADHAFFKRSGGGVTFSGGEPVLQNIFLSGILKRCKENGLHTAVDTAGNVLWEMFESILPNTDLFLYDIKMITPEKHLEATGVRNDKILENLTELCRRNAKIWVRVPIIPDFHNADEISKIAAFLKDLPLERIELIPYHRYGVGKYKSLGVPYTLTCTEPSAEQMREMAELFAGCHAELVVQ